MTIPADILTYVIGGIATIVTAIFKAFRFVHEGERGIKLQFGKAVRDRKGQPIVIEPGFVLLFPFIQTLSSHHVRQQSYRFPEQRVVLKDGLIFKICGMTIFRVVDVYRALFEIENVDNSIDDLCMAAIKDEVEQLTHEQLAQRDALSDRLRNMVKVRAAEWGIEILQLSLPECAPTPETANLLNARLGVKMRLDALEEGLKEHGLTIETVSPNLAAVLVGIPLVASTESPAGQTQPQSKLVQAKHHVEIHLENKQGDQD